LKTFNQKKQLFYIHFKAFILGCFSLFCFAPYNLYFLNFLIFTSFLLIFYKNKKILTFKQSFIYGCAFGFGYFLSNIHWITISLTFDESFKILIPFALIIIPLFLSIFIGLATVLSRTCVDNKISFVIYFSILFSLFEFIRGTIFTGFPWNLIAFSWSQSIENIQILSLIGTYSLSLFSITLFCSPFLLFVNKFKIKDIVFLGIIFLMFISNYVYGFMVLKNDNNFTYSDITIKIISSNILLHDSLKSNSEIKEVENLITLSEPKDEEKTIFIWPEGSLKETDLRNIKLYEKIFSKNFSKNHIIVLGINSTSGEGINKKYFNSMAVLNNQANIISTYHKNKLVPFGEFLPFEFFLSKFGLKKITEGYNSFSKGSDRKIIKLAKKFNNISFLPLICYEIIYTGKIKRKNQSPDLIINISEDGWFGNSVGPYQHFSHAKFRAVEEGLFVARSTNNGVSAFIDSKGRVIKSLKNGKSGVLKVKSPIFLKNTFFSKYGNNLFFFFLLLYILFFLILKKYEK
tara:strand:+ start:6397 stop:7947 length:1551 start_codon:yes stop_codon:yes gene_type:complete